MTDDTAHADQVQAAVAQAARTTGLLAEMRDMNPDRVHGETVEAAVDRITRRILDGQAKVCPHVGSPTALFVALAFPDLLCCASCFANVVIPALKQPERAWVCDLCGQTERDFTDIASQNGPLLITGAVCQRCAPPKGTE